MFSKIFFASESKPAYPKIFLILRNFKDVFIFDTSNIFINSVQPLAALYINLLSFGKDLSLTIIPSILKDAALLIIEPIFLGSVTSSKSNKIYIISIQILIKKSFKSNFSKCLLLQ